MRWENLAKTGLLNNKTLWCRGRRVRRMNMRRRNAEEDATDFVEWTCLDKDMWGNRRNIAKSIDYWGNWIRQHKKTLAYKGKNNSPQRKPLPLKFHLSLRTLMHWKQTWKPRRQSWNLSTRKSPESKLKRSKLKLRQQNLQRKPKQRTCWKSCWPVVSVQTRSSQSWNKLFRPQTVWVWLQNLIHAVL